MKRLNEWLTPRWAICVETHDDPLYFTVTRCYTLRTTRKMCNWMNLHRSQKDIERGVRFVGTRV